LLKPRVEDLYEAIFTTESYIPPYIVDRLLMGESISTYILVPVKPDVHFVLVLECF